MERKKPKKHKVTRNGKTFWRGSGASSVSKKGAGKEFSARSVSLDLFEHYDKIKDKSVLALIDKMETALENGDPYKTLATHLKKFEKKGYTFDYGLDGSPFGLKRIKGGAGKQKPSGPSKTADKTLGHIVTRTEKEGSHSTQINPKDAKFLKAKLKARKYSVKIKGNTLTATLTN